MQVKKEQFAHLNKEKKLERKIKREKAACMQVKKEQLAHQNKERKKLERRE